MPDCRRERAYLVDDLARFNSPKITLAQIIHRMRCQACNTRPPRAAWLSTGPTLNKRMHPRRFALLGPDARD